MTDHFIHANHPDDERYDSITIDIEPRWKESEISGDEWRFSYTIRAHRKGEVIKERSFNRLRWAIDALGYLVSIADESHNHDAWKRTEHLCDQPGCPWPATAFFERLKEYTPGGDEIVGTQTITTYRQFCEDHEQRGDCSRDDAEHNYRRIANPKA